MVKDLERDNYFLNQQICSQKNQSSRQKSQIQFDSSLLNTSPNSGSSGASNANIRFLRRTPMSDTPLSNAGPSHASSSINKVEIINMNSSGKNNKSGVQLLLPTVTSLSVPVITSPQDTNLLSLNNTPTSNIHAASSHPNLPPPTTRGNAPCLKLSLQTASPTPPSQNSLAKNSNVAFLTETNLGLTSNMLSNSAAPSLMNSTVHHLNGGNSSLNSTLNTVINVNTNVNDTMSTTDVLHSESLTTNNQFSLNFTTFQTSPAKPLSVVRMSSPSLPQSNYIHNTNSSIANSSSSLGSTSPGPCSASSTSAIGIFSSNVTNILNNNYIAPLSSPVNNLTAAVTGLSILNNNYNDSNYINNHGKNTANNVGLTPTKTNTSFNLVNSDISNISPSSSSSHLYSRNSTGSSSLRVFNNANISNSSSSSSSIGISKHLQQSNFQVNGSGSSSQQQFGSSTNGNTIKTPTSSLVLVGQKQVLEMRNLSSKSSQSTIMNAIHANQNSSSSPPQLLQGSVVNALSLQHPYSTSPSQSSALASISSSPELIAGSTENSCITSPNSATVDSLSIVLENQLFVKSTNPNPNV